VPSALMRVRQFGSESHRGDSPVSALGLLNANLLPAGADGRSGRGSAKAHWRQRGLVDAADTRSGRQQRPLFSFSKRESNLNRHTDVHRLSVLGSGRECPCVHRIESRISRSVLSIKGLQHRRVPRCAVRSDGALDQHGGLNPATAAAPYRRAGGNGTRQRRTRRTQLGGRLGSVGLRQSRAVEAAVAPYGRKAQAHACASPLHTGRRNLGGPPRIAENR
jgi:hypothetical protein